MGEDGGWEAAVFLGGGLQGLWCLPLGRSVTGTIEQENANIAGQVQKSLRGLCRRYRW